MRPRVLIVDDDDLMRASLEIQAEGAGYHAVTAANGREAIELARQKAFDLVVCDIRMPGMNGLDAISEIRQLLPEARAIVITGYASPDTPVTALKMRVDDYLLKPFDGKTFLASVEKVLSDHQQRRVVGGGDPRALEHLHHLIRTAREGNQGAAARAAQLASRLGFSPQRTRLVYLAALLAGAHPETFSAFPGLRKLATVVSRVNDAEAPLESRVVATALENAAADPELTRLLAETGGEFALPEDDSVGQENLLTLADKHRQAGRWDQAEHLYAKIDSTPELQARARLGLALVLAGTGEIEQALTAGRTLLEFCHQNSLDLAAAEAVLELASLGPVDMEELRRARSVFATWEQSADLAAVDLLLAQAGDAAAAQRWMEAPEAELALRRFPERGSLVLKSSPEAKKRVLAQGGLQVSLLGNFKVEFEGQTLEEEAWPSRRDRDLFIYLAAHRGEVTHEEKLMDLFWPSGGKKAKHSLHNSISQIRKTLAGLMGPTGRKLIQRKMDGYLLSRDCSVDLDDFQEHFEHGRAAAESGAWKEALSHLQRAERLHRGTFLEGNYEEWSARKRLLLQDLLVQCRLLLADYYSAQGKTEMAVELWRRVLKHDNCCEEAYLGLVEGLRELGREGEAVKVYHDCVKAFKEELDLPPPANLARFYFEALNQA